MYKKQLFDLEVKGQDPTKVITVCNTPPYGHAPCTHIPNIIDLSRDKNVMARTRKYVVQTAALRGDISFRYLKQFFLVALYFNVVLFDFMTFTD
jgi:hypothetical protein